MEFRRRRRHEPQVNVIPLVDILLLLLVFFLLTTTFRISLGGLDILLPRGGAGRGSEAGELVIAVSAGGEIFWEDGRGTPAELRAWLSMHRADLARRTAVIKADGEARHGVVVEVMDAVRSAGYGRIVVAAQPAR